MVDGVREETTAPELIRLSEPGQESGEPERRERRPRAVKIVLALLGAVVIALAAFTGPTIVRVMQQKNPAIAMPPQVGELRRDDSDLAREHASDLVAILRAQIADLENSSGAVYTVPSGDATHSVMLVAGATLLWNPEAELDAVLGFISESSEDPLKELKEVDAGPLGGVMKCGTTQMDASPMAVCGWADHGSIALALFPARSIDEAAGLMRDLRTASIKR